MARFALRLTTRHQLALAIAGGLTGVVLLARFLYIPLWGQLAQRQATLKSLHVKIADARLFMERLPIEEAALKDAEARRQALERRIGHGQSLARILEQLGQQARARHLELVSVQPRAGEREDHTVTLGPELALREVPLTLQVTGRYRQMGEFLGELPKAPYVAAVKSLHMTRPDPDSPKLNADIVLAVYLAPGVTR